MRGGRGRDEVKGVRTKRVLGGKRTRIRGRGTEERSNNEFEKAFKFSSAYSSLLYSSLRYAFRFHKRGLGKHFNS